MEENIPFWMMVEKSSIEIWGKVKRIEGIVPEVILELNHR